MRTSATRHQIFEAGVMVADVPFRPGEPEISEQWQYLSNYLVRLHGRSSANPRLGSNRKAARMALAALKATNQARREK
jgi:hypothetical protein